MPTGYPEEYLLNNEVISESWGTDKHNNAKTLRNRRAKELRKEGWVVNCGMYDYTDLGRFRLFWLEGAREVMFVNRRNTHA